VLRLRVVLCALGVSAVLLDRRWESTAEGAEDCSAGNTLCSHYPEDGGLEIPETNMLMYTALSGVSPLLIDSPTKEQLEEDHSRTHKRIRQNGTC
jgi:hypothetical protein